MSRTNLSGQSTMVLFVLCRQPNVVQCTRKGVGWSSRGLWRTWKSWFFSFVYHADWLQRYFCKDKRRPYKEFKIASSDQRLPEKKLHNQRPEELRSKQSRAGEVGGLLCLFGEEIWGRLNINWAESGWKGKLLGQVIQVCARIQQNRYLASSHQPQLRTLGPRSRQTRTNDCHRAWLLRRGARMRYSELPKWSWVAKGFPLQVGKK